MNKFPVESRDQGWMRCLSMRCVVLRTSRVGGSGVLGRTTASCPVSDPLAPRAVLLGGMARL